MTGFRKTMLRESEMIQAEEVWTTLTIHAMFVVVDTYYVLVYPHKKVA
jgi:hypothetical protein